MLERIQVDNDISEVSDGELYNALNDRVNDAYGLVYALANFFSPLVGSMLNRNFGQRSTCDYIFIFDMAFAVFLFVFNCGFAPFAENRKFLANLNLLRASEEQLDDARSQNTNLLSAYAKSDFLALHGKSRTISDLAFGLASKPEEVKIRAHAGRLNFLAPSGTRERTSSYLASHNKYSHIDMSRNRF